MSDAVQGNPSEVNNSSSNPAGENKAETQESATTEQKPASTEADAKTADKGETDKSKKEKPKRVPRPKKEGEVETADNEIRVAAKGQIKNYLGYAFRILNKTDHRSMTIRATGNAIVKALILIELVKRRVGDLHQRNKIYSMEIESFEESKIEGMEKIATKRRVTAMDTELSKDPLDENDPGYQKPEPKEEGQVISNPPKQKEKKGKSKKHRGPKLYNQLPGEEGKDKKDAQDGDKKKRRDGDTNQKHGQENENKKNKKKKNKGGQEDENKGPEGGQGGKKKGKSRKENLRNIINDDEMPRGLRGIRGMRGGRGGPARGGRGGYNMGPMMDRGDFPGGPRFEPMYTRDNREYGGPQGGFVPRSNDDFFVRPPQRGGRGGRRGGPPDMYPQMRYNYGPPRGYEDHYYDEYYNGPMYHGPRGGYNAPGNFRRDPRDMPPGSGPRGGYRPDFDQRQGQPPMGGRGGMPPRGGRREDHPEDDPRANRGREGGRGRGGPPRQDGPPPYRGGMRPPRGRGGHNEKDDQAPILHRRARGGGGESARGGQGGHGGRD